MFSCEREPTNVNDRYAVAVVKDDVAFGHLPRAQSKIYSLFLLRNGTINCIITGTQVISSKVDLKLLFTCPTFHSVTLDLWYHTWLHAILYLK